MQNNCEWFTAMIANEEQLRECYIRQKCNSSHKRSISLLVDDY